MLYQISIYDRNSDNSARFTLGTEGRNPLFVIGLNPSTADDQKPDLTISKVIGFATRNGCDSFIMLNLCAQRATFPKNLDVVLNEQLHNENLTHILNSLGKYKTAQILASWGETIKVRDYFHKCLTDIVTGTKDKNVRWLKIGLTKSGHPRHPSRAKYSELSDFDIEGYLTQLNSK